MVLIIEHEGRKYYACSICRLVYESLNYATLCEKYCSKGKCCGVNITSFAIGYAVEEDGVMKTVFLINKNSSLEK